MTKSNRSRDFKVSTGEGAPKERGKLPIYEPTSTQEKAKRRRDAKGRFKAEHRVEISDARTDSQERDKALLARLNRRAKRLREEKATPTLTLAELREAEGKGAQPEVSEAVEDTRHDDIASKFAASSEARAEELRKEGEESNE
jgi:hypothetical protein